MSVTFHYCICAKGVNCQNISSALKLQESVKEVIEHRLLYSKIGSREACLVTEQTIDLLQSLVKESERNTSGGKSN